MYGCRRISMLFRGFGFVVWFLFYVYCFELLFLGLVLTYVYGDR